MALAGASAGIGLLCGCGKPANDIGGPLNTFVAGSIAAPSVTADSPFGKVVPVSDVSFGGQGSGISEAFGMPESLAPGQIGGLGQPDVAGGERGADADYIGKSDVYWKLNWLKKKIAEGDLPANFVEAVLKTRNELSGLDRDRNFDVASEAIEHLDRGIEHLQALKTLGAAFVPTETIPWGAGTRAMRRFIDNGGLGFGEKRDEPTMDMGTGPLDKDDATTDLMSVPTGAEAYHATGLSTQQEKAIEVVMDYESRYHMSPDKVMREEWRAAMEKIDDLRDDLGLMNRKENKDNDITEPGINMETSRVQMSAGDQHGVEGVVPMPSVTAPAAGTGEELPTDASRPVRSMRSDDTDSNGAQ
jgi:hypothetical protein